MRAGQTDRARPSCRRALHELPLLCRNTRIRLVALSRNVVDVGRFVYDLGMDHDTGAKPQLAGTNRVTTVV